MDPTFERQYHRLEDTYWWFRARRDYLVRLVTKHLALAHDAAILELGCSGGPLLAALRDAGYTHLTGLDLSPDAIALCHSRGLPNTHVMDATAPALPEASFDLLLASDILEHLEHPDLALAHWSRLLKPGGLLVVFVPAFPCLWTAHDDLNRHFRRYRLPNLTAALQAAGLQIVTRSYWNFTLFAPVATLRLLQRRASHPPPTDQLTPLPRLLDALLYTLLRCENTLLLRGLRYPIGVSALAIAQKP